MYFCFFLIISCLIASVAKSTACILCQLWLITPLFFRQLLVYFQGHTCTPVLGGDRVLVLGGSNHGAYHSLRDVMIWHASTATWVKLQTRLAPGCIMPSSAMFHSATPLEAPLVAKTHRSVNGKAHTSSSIDGKASSSCYTDRRRDTDMDSSSLCYNSGTRRVLMFGGILGDVPGTARASHVEHRPPQPHLFVLDLPSLRCKLMESVWMYCIFFKSFT